MRTEDNRLEGKLNEALSCMHAPDDLYENVVARAADGRPRRRGHAWPAASVMAAALVGVLALGGTAYAVTSGGFFQRAWGSHGQDEVVRWSYDTGSEVLHFSRDYGGVVPEDLSEDLADAVGEVGYAVEANGYTLKIEDAIIDENGAGAATFTLENPDGVKYYPQYGMPGEFVLDGEDTRVGDLSQLVVRWGDEEFTRSEVMYDADAATPTKLQGTIYFMADDPGSVSKGISWALGFTDHDAETDAYKPEHLVPVRSFGGDAEGKPVVEVSPFAVTVDTGAPKGVEPLIDHLSLQLSNGKEIVVADDDEGAVNYYTGSILSDNTVAYTSTQLIDAQDVKAIRMTLRTYEGERGDAENVREYELALKG